ncbi:tetratricopeptide repeat protein [Azoarcus sp. PA01]|nr:tetratricopeptide repeat protein [Azoarcus sp. PA01]
MLKRKLLITTLIGAGLIGTIAFGEYRAWRMDNTSALLTTIGAPFCAPQRSGPQHKTFFRLAMAQAESGRAPARTEVGPFSRAIPDAESIAHADANPRLMDDLGTLHYPITTSIPTAQRFFDQGLRLAYAFNHGEALRAFRKARTLDPECAMCYWGEALVLGPNINAPMDAAAVAPAFDAVTKAQQRSASASAKERALIEALTARYAQAPQADRAALDAAYADAMQRVAQCYPDDDQITLTYAEALMDRQPWDYWEAGGFLPKGRAAEIVALLEKVLRRTPDHPGAIHYYIHLTESSSDPGRAVPYAQRLGRLMPGAGHVVHMPFHTFFRVGMYKEAIEANRQAVRADETYIARSAPVGIYPQAYYPHNIHSLMVSAQMAGDGASAIESADKLGRIVSDAAARNIPWVQPIMAAPYFAHAQFSDAKTILALPDPGADFPYVQAMWHYARGVGLAGAGDVSAAQAEVDAIVRLEQQNDFADLVAGGVPAKDVLRLAEQVLRARIAQANRDPARAVRHFEAAVALEDRLAYTEPPYWYYPTRQSLGAALLLAGDLDNAENVLRSSLARAPNNGWALFGLMRLYEQRGDAASAQAVRTLLDKAWIGDPRILELSRL